MRFRVLKGYMYYQHADHMPFFYKNQKFFFFFLKNTFFFFFFKNFFKKKYLLRFFFLRPGEPNNLLQTIILKHIQNIYHNVNNLYIQIETLII